MTFTALLLAVFSGIEQEPANLVLHNPHPVWDVSVDDVTGDGHPDILVLAVDDDVSPPVKSLALFAGSSASTYREQPDAEFEIPWQFGTVLVAQTDTSPAAEVLLANHSGVQILAWDGSNFAERSRVDVQTLLPSGTHEPIFLRDAVRDLDADGIDEWLLPVPEGYAVAGPDGVRRTVQCDLTGEMRYFGRHLISHQLPVIQTFPQSGSDTLGIALLTDRGADLFYGDAWEQHQTYRIPKALEDKWDFDAVMDDINADGFPDIVVSQTQGTTNMKVKTRVFVAERPFVYPDTPTAEFESKGAYTVPTLRDVDGDERLDLIFVGLSFGLRNIVNYFVRGKISVEIDAHQFRDSGFPKKAHRDTRLSMDAPEGREQVAYVMGDFTGDGRLDALVAVKRDRLSLFEGTEDRLIARRATHKFDLPAFGVARRCNIDGDERDDVVIFHRQNEQQRRIEVLIF